MPPLKFSSAVDGYLLNARARRLSPNTINDYANTYNKFLTSMGDLPIDAISPDLVRQFLISQPVSKKTVSNYHVALSALFTWLIADDLADSNPLHQVPRPKPEKRSIKPLTRSDIKALLSACSNSKPYTRPGKSESTHAVLTADRDRAILLLLLDTGIRASELTAIKIRHLDLDNRTIKIFGKGSKERIVPISPRTAQKIWRYLATRPDDTVNQPLFVTLQSEPLTRNRLLKIIYAVASRAGIQDVHPHRFRHTFAIQYLKNGGDPFSLQMILGHSNMETVRNYLNIAQTDLETNHQRASPVDNWKL